jgi:sterol 3beta-glucosyltransferase
MRIALIALGSRGDVQPYIALGKGLAAVGHAVRLISHQDFETLIKAQALEFWPMRGNVQAVAESPEMLALLEKGNFIAITAHTAREAERAALMWAEDGLAACQGIDLIIAGIGGLFIGLALAEKLGIRFLQAYLVPFTPTREFASVLLPPALPKFGGAFNRLSHDLTRQMMWQGFRSGDQLARRDVLGLAPARFWGPFGSERMRGQPILYGFSPTVLPRPADWDERVTVTGYWFLEPDPAWTPPLDLITFLQDGPPPVYIGFGSMGNRKPEETADLVLGALARSRQRAILLSGWGGLRKVDLPDSVYMADSLPHAWLFPRVAAAVHHGGAGTTAASLRAGVPTLVTPFFGDQPFWGQRAADLGAGPRPIPRNQLTVERLARAIEIAVNDPAMRRRAADLGVRIRAENGLARAVEVIETLG